ncbi:hypothetical protein TNCV_4013661 [Trichonephila clavipes]|nr:hypothetical protein TNCV_4013661 [Trichonephila clavipes]
MGIAYHAGIKATVDEMATHILSREGQIQTNAVRMCKIMASVFWDRNGVLLVDFMPQGTTIISDAFRATLRVSEEHCKTNSTACFQKVFCSSTITQGPTLLERLGN